MPVYGVSAQFQASRLFYVRAKDEEQAKNYVINNLADYEEFEDQHAEIEVTGIEVADESRLAQDMGNGMFFFERVDDAEEADEDEE
jgi:hypothetical protein